MPSLAFPCLALPCLALPCLALPCLALPYIALPCLVLPCLALPCLALPCLALPCLASLCLALPFSASPCPLLPRLTLPSSHVVGLCACGSRVCDAHLWFICFGVGVLFASWLCVSACLRFYKIFLCANICVWQLIMHRFPQPSAATRNTSEQSSIGKTIYLHGSERGAGRG